MCGISGIFHYDREHSVDPVTLRGMREASVHRGPDDHGEYLSGNVGLSFNRLSIIDLSGGHQPMCNEDGSVWIVFNGEIYNFAELRRDLISLGHRFATASDTETIIHAFEQYGAECVDKLRGMFAFVIWDKRQQVLFGARDRLGIKPLYYYNDGDRFIFASELKSLLEVAEVPRDVDHAAFGEFLRRRYVVAPNTMLRGIFKLQPGHRFTLQSSGLNIERYWDLPLEPDSDVSESDAVERLDALLRDCVRSHLISDVPLGAFLSGGLDSSCIVGLMSRLGGEVKTFSIGYDSPQSELPHARIVADHFHTQHHELHLSAVAFRDVLPKIAWHLDEPIGDSASIPLYFLSHFARQNVTVVLSGEGSDEIFAGYEIYGRMLDFERYNRVPFARTIGNTFARLLPDNKFRKYGEMLGSPIEHRYAGVGALFSTRQAEALCRAAGSSYDGGAAAYSRCANAGILQRMAYVDTNTWLADDLLVKADRMTMANSLELRVPFLDHELVEFAARLPSRLKIRRGSGKYVLKKWAEALLPRQIVRRRKAGFPVPTREWFRQELAGYARETLLAKDAASADFLEKKGIKDLMEAHQREDRSDQIFSLLIFDSWHGQFVTRKPQCVSAAV